MTTLRKCLPVNVLEMISNILGDTNDGLTGTEIHRFLLQANIDDVDQTNTKRYRLFNALANEQNRHKCSNQILNFIGLVLAPSRFVNNHIRFNELRASINQQLAFVGYELQENGKYRIVEQASTISDVEIKVTNLKQELKNRKAHQEIFKYCTAELLQNNYFHSVLEANKGLFQRIRDLSTIQKDGINLIEEVFRKNSSIIC